MKTKSRKKLSTKGERETLQIKIKQLRKKNRELERFRKQCGELEARYAQLQKEHGELEAKYLQLQEENRKLRAECERLRENDRIQKANLAEANDKLLKLVPNYERRSRSPYPELLTPEARGDGNKRKYTGAGQRSPRFTSDLRSGSADHSKGKRNSTASGGNPRAKFKKW